VLKRGKAFLAAKFLSYAKMIEHKIWDGLQTPLRQFLGNGHRDMKAGGPGSGAGQTGGLLKMPTIMRIEERNIKIDELIDMEANEISAILKHNTLGHTVKQCLSYIPYLSVEAKVQPITRTVLKIDMELTPEFVWNDRQHGQVESFYIWIEDTNNEHIYHSEHFLLHKKQMNEVHKLTFTIPIHEPLPPQYYIKILSDRWMGSENVHALNFKHLILPELYPSNTELLDLHPLPRSALMNAAYERLYAHKFTHFNPIQTQIFHTLYHTDENVLLGAPTGSGEHFIGVSC
jgi:activating signal cointegrator complex subunit 3